MAAVALAHGLNGNRLRRWVVEKKSSGLTLASGISPPQVEFLALPFGYVSAAAACGRRHLHRTAPWRRHGHDPLAGAGRRRLRRLVARMAAMIRVDAVWLAVPPIDMRAGTDTALARAYMFTNRRANRIKVLVHDGLGSGTRLGRAWLIAQSASGMKAV
jgi:hypothetical protein